MIKVTESGTLEVYPQSQGLNFFTHLRWLFLLPVLGSIAWLVHMAVGSVMALLVVLVLSVASFFYIKKQQQHHAVHVASGMYRVDAGCVAHVLGTQCNTYHHNGQSADITDGNGNVELTLFQDNKKQPLVVFGGFETRKEAEVMLACLQGKTIGTRKKTIRMKST